MISTKTVHFSCRPGDDHSVFVVATDRARSRVVVPEEGIVMKAWMRRSDRHSFDHHESFPLEVARAGPETLKIKFSREATERLEYGRMRWHVTVEDTGSFPSKFTTLAEGSVHPRR